MRSIDEIAFSTANCMFQIAWLLGFSDWRIHTCIIAGPKTPTRWDDRVPAVPRDSC